MDNIKKLVKFKGSKTVFGFVVLSCALYSFTLYPVFSETLKMCVRYQVASLVAQSFPTGAWVVSPNTPMNNVKIISGGQCDISLQAGAKANFYGVTITFDDPSNSAIKHTFKIDRTLNMLIYYRKDIDMYGFESPFTFTLDNKTSGGYCYFMYSPTTKIADVEFILGTQYFNYVRLATKSSTDIYPCSSPTSAPSPYSP